MNKRTLILGDTLAIAFVTIIGFVSHGESGLSFLPRMAAIFFPLFISWFVLAQVTGLFEQGTTSNPKQLWRPALSAIFAASLATVLRGFLLKAPVIPIFAVVLGITFALGMVIWRGTYLLLNHRMQK
jgi:hypothetical protein